MQRTAVRGGRTFYHTRTSRPRAPRIANKDAPRHVDCRDQSSASSCALARRCAKL
jgi:hypothetical protein